MKLKSVILGSLLILSCDYTSNNTQKSISKIEEEDIPKCIYRYFMNDKHELDSNIIECPEIVPVRPMRLHPLHIDSVEVWNIG